MRLQVMVLVFASSLLCGRVVAQAGGDPQGGQAAEEKGFVSVVQVGGSVNSSSRVFKLDSVFGYNFSSRLGADVGLPIYFVHATDAATGANTSNTGIGNPYFDLRLTLRSPAVNYRSVWTVFPPLGNKKSGLNTGRVTADWTNRLEHSFSRLTPFVDAGIGNTIRDSRLFERPFTSLGFNAHFEGGASFEIAEPLQFGASGYAIVPAGQQRIYSRLMRANMGGASQNGRVFETATETVGTADLARDHGFSAWIGATPSECLDVEIGYTRSIPYDLNTVSFTVGVNVGRLAHMNSKQ